MVFEGEYDKMRFQRMAGGDIVARPPVFSADGEYLFTISGHAVKVYSSATGEFVRELVCDNDDKEHNVIAMQLELKQNDVLVVCSSVGLLYRWTWSTGKQISRMQLRVTPKDEVLTFNLLNLYGKTANAHAIITTRRQNERVRWCVYDTDKGDIIQTRCKLGLSDEKVHVAVQTNCFHNLIVAQGFRVYFINYKTWAWKALNNAHKVPVTSVCVHPEEELVATGDELGKIFLWREFMDHRKVTTSLYHWHHTKITSVAFSAVGRSLYSSALESVLVKWNVDRPNMRQFVPRVCAIILHIAVSGDNSRVAISTADNGVQFVGNDNKLMNTLQDFTYVSDDKTGRPQFPIGLRFNPRNNTLMLNGRTGHIQCFSTYSRHFLYNIDIVGQNRQSMEARKILYDTQVVKAAFNIDWMVTGEEYNDEEHLPELRMKFWKYDEKNQSYTLNTCIELPHEYGFKALEFSNANQVDNLLCASVGADNEIRIWSLDESDNIYHKGKVWYCIGKTNYKNMPIESISFSQDGSLLAAGCGNTLCVYKAESLKLLAALSSTCGNDGSAQKAQIVVPKPGSKKPINGSRKELIEQQKRTLQLFMNMLESKDETLLKEIKKSQQTNSDVPPEKLKSPCKLDDKQCAQIYSQVMQMHELNLWQKLQIFQSLGISCQVHPQWHERMLAYIKQTIAPMSINEKITKLHTQVDRLNARERFKAKYRLYRYMNWKKHYDNEVAKHLVPIMSVLNLTDTTQPAEKIKTNGFANKDDDSGDKKQATDDSEAVTSTPLLPPMQMPAQLMHVQFAAGEYAHLVITCTESRVLIWNLLTLRLHSLLKLSVNHLAFDVHNNLIAAVTKSNELHVFQPNVPLPIYQRSNIPNLNGIIWLPRKHMRQRSINVDWQAQSILYFLTKNQDIIYLSKPNDQAVVEDLPLPASTATATGNLQYTTFGAYATKHFSEQQQQQNKSILPIGPVVLGNTAQQAVKSLLSMSTHTMPPMSLMCLDFVKAMTTPIETTTNNETATVSMTNGNMNGHASDEDDDDDDDDSDFNMSQTTRATTNTAMTTNTTTTSTSTSTMEKRRALLAKSEKIAIDSKQATANTSSETQLKRIAEQFDFDLTAI